MIKLEKGMVLANLANLAMLIKTYVDGRISALAAAVSTVMEDVDSSITALEEDMKTKGNCETLTFQDVEVAADLWEEDGTYSFYSYRAAVPCAAVTAGHIPDVVFGFKDAESMNYAGAAESAEGIIYIYAKEKPEGTVVVPMIEARKAAE